MLRAIREIKPRYVVGENVRGLLSWNGGLVFDEVQTDLENEGFEVIPFILPAASVNAPHKRDRVWFVAHANDKGGRGELGDIPKANGEVSQRNEDTEPSNANQSDVTDWDSFPSQPPVLCGDDGIPRELDGITFPKWRKESIKGYGNAIVPQVVYPIFKAIERLD
jgi:DNA (cytosine-5)-methyltransferase 1